jgi:hypothetical protein
MGGCGFCGSQEEVAMGTLIWSIGIDTQRRMELVDQVARDVQNQMHGLPMWVIAEELTHNKRLQIEITLVGSYLHVDIRSETVAAS